MVVGTGQARITLQEEARSRNHPLSTSLTCCSERNHVEESDMLPEKAAIMVNIKTTRPLELVCIDFLSLEPDKSNTKDILVITDHFGLLSNT